MSLTTKTIVTAAVGGILVGISAALLCVGHYAPWLVFNAAIGAFLIFVATRLGQDLAEKPLPEPPSR